MNQNQYVIIRYQQYRKGGEELYYNFIDNLSIFIL